ncbi:glycosyl hydrolase catalytic core-domain-containing protein [Exophiala viscosa]|uniref:Glycosyl hydrolase catalytic core-domain-containing protein n=1 Tax=Exophiala viscosa TaxID=2486360 RepID=A0AAN6DMR5_9EURO|nr:glycosyl hydrolase catalytic core-domain-containing protein [Exophiala viscosa]KAI1625445.1 glycosyl hydrolase catalytic core-domain-containing protein [Exophiala viscosa]
MTPILLRIVLLAALLSITTASSTNSTTPKRGLTYISTTHSSTDDRIFTTARSPLTWYYNYAYTPSSISLPFAPMIHSASDAQDAISTIESLDVTHVLTFNEPDGSTASGGTNTTPSDAASIWLDAIAPLRLPPYDLFISLPATTGSSQGLTWLSEFNTSCYALNSSGCEFDFVATHWYGDFDGLASWLGQLHALYPNKKIWLTEFAVPAVSATDTLSFMNESLTYLDRLSYVERYGWFGAFRTDDAGAFTGGGVSMFDNSGKLTELGATYLGGEADGFEEGQRSDASVAKCGATTLTVLGLDLIVMMVMEVW